jgi:hypothetical protein
MAHHGGTENIKTQIKSTPREAQRFPVSGLRVSVVKIAFLQIVRGPGRLMS